MFGQLEDDAISCIGGVYKKPIIQAPAVELRWLELGWVEQPIARTAVVVPAYSLYNVYCSTMKSSNSDTSNSRAHFESRATHFCKYHTAWLERISCFFYHFVIVLKGKLVARQLN